jgi:hypothetical protein
MSSNNSYLFDMFETLSRPFMSYIWYPSMFAFVGSIGIVLALWQRIDILQDEQTKPQSMEKFDFIVGSLSYF